MYASWFVLVLSMAPAPAYKTVPLNHFMGIVPKQYTWPAPKDCLRAFELMRGNVVDNAKARACLMQTAEAYWLKIAGPYARNPDLDIFSEDDIEIDCERFYEQTRPLDSQMKMLLDAVKQMPDTREGRAAREGVREMDAQLEVPDMSAICK